MCSCEEQPTLVDISNAHSDFTGKLKEIAVGNWVMLMQCPDCNQLWKVDAWDKLQSLYAVKIANDSEWENFDSEALIKERIIENRGGLTPLECMRSGCNQKQVKGSAFCINHLYETGTRA